MLQNDLVLLISQRGTFGSRNVGGKLCIGNKYLNKYMQNIKKPTSNKTNIKRRLKTCISAMLFQSDMN